MRVFIARKRAVILLMVLLFLYLFASALRKLSRIALQYGATIKDRSGHVHCEASLNLCGSGQFNLDMLSEDASAGLILCSRGASAALVTLATLGNYFHIIQLPNTDHSPEPAPGQEQDPPLSRPTHNEVISTSNRMLLKSYGEDNLFKLREFVDATADTSYLAVFAFAGIELPSEELTNEVKRIFHSEKFEHLKTGLLYYAVYSKHLDRLVHEEVFTLIRNIDLRMCLEDRSTKVAHIEPIGTHTPIQLSPKGSEECTVVDPDTNHPLRCGRGTVPISLYSSTSGDVFPRYCVNGKNVSFKGSRKLGRGLHLMQLSPKWELISYDVFDTYESRSEVEKMYKALSGVSPKAIVAVSSHDEASNLLSPNLKGVLSTLGSSLVSRLKYRDSWVFIGQKNLSGKSKFEVLTKRKPSDTHAGVSSIRECVGATLPVKLWTDTLADGFHQFCQNQPTGYEKVCRNGNISFQIEPPAPEPPGWFGFFQSSPILVIPDLSRYEAHVSLFRTLESIARQPHLRPEMVYVALGKNDFVLEFHDIVDIFSYNVLSFEYKKVQCFAVPFNDAAARVMALPNVKQTTVIGPEVTVHSDFLHYVFSVSPLLANDERLAAISAWNPNGFRSTGYPADSLFRIENFPLYGWVLTRRLLEKLTAGKETFKNCCENRKWYQGWSLPTGAGEGTVVVPGVSRVSLPHIDEAYSVDALQWMQYANDRLTSASISTPFGVFFNTNSVRSPSSYSSYMDKLISKCEKNFILHGEKSIDQIAKVLDSPPDTRPSCVTIRTTVKLKGETLPSYMHTLFGNLNMIHEEPFGFYKGAIFHYYKSVPVFILDPTFRY